MKLSERRPWVSGLVLTMAAAGVAHAHHSFAMFDGSKKIELHGTVVKFEWTNPHVWIQLLADDPAGGRSSVRPSMGWGAAAGHRAP
jgi:Family of unknown function (DUF6152)